MDWMRRIWIAALILAIVFAAGLWYSAKQRMEIIRRDVITLGLPENILREEDYLVGYKNEEFTVSRFVFSSSDDAIDFSEKFVSSVYAGVGEEVEIGRYSGSLVRVGETEFGLLARKDNEVVIGKGYDSRGLIEVIGWLTESS